VEDFINIYITNDDAVRVPTGFTPNCDFNNDILTVYGRENVKIIEFKVYDRWGELMYSNEDFLVNDDDLGWNGTFRDQEMPPGVYTWYVKAELTNGFAEVYSGNTTLIR
jgi:gliding motility-associated-like protein